jgi:hypothetical protein
MIEIISNPKLLYYVTKRIIQEDIRLGLIDRNTVADVNLLNLSKEGIELEYFGKSKVLSSETKKSDSKKVVVLTIVTYYSLLDLVKDINKKYLSDSQYKCYVTTNDSMGVIETKKPDIVVVPFDLANSKRILQKARLANPDLQIIMYFNRFYDMHDSSDIRKEYEYFQSLNNVSFISLNNGSFIDFWHEDNDNNIYEKEIKQARDKVMQDRAQKIQYSTSTEYWSTNMYNKLQSAL